jgi:hypothetical protein
MRVMTLDGFKEFQWRDMDSLPVEVPRHREPESPAPAPVMPKPELEDRFEFDVSSDEGLDMGETPLPSPLDAA